MAVSQAHIRATRKWEKENYWKFTMRLPKDYEQRVKATGKSISGFIREAVDFYFENHKE
jgi:predicted DNA-binding protein